MTHCNFIKSDGSKCKEKSLPTSKKGLCIFHEKLEDKDVNLCMNRFYDKIRNGETDFEGYILKNVNLKEEKIKNIGTENKPINFRNSIFLGGVDFNHVEFSGEADFNHARFSGRADFEDARFSRDADFRSAKFSGEADFEDARFSGMTGFWGARFSGEADFAHARFSKDADFWDASFSKDADFIHARFSGRADFKDASFSKDADFRSARFSGEADFNHARFSGRADFEDARFSGMTGFWGARFSGRADFNNARFSGRADFNNARFSGEVDFEDARFSKDADFNHARFSGEADFEDARFSGEADFWGAKFSEEIFFTDSIFETVADFSESSFERKGSFKGASLNIASFCDAELRHVVFDDVDLTKTAFHGAILEDAYISNAIFRKKISGGKEGGDHDRDASNKKNKKERYGGMMLWEEKEARYGWKQCKYCENLIIFPLRHILYIQDFLRDHLPSYINNKKLIQTVKFFQDSINIPFVKPSMCEICGKHFAEKTVDKNKDSTYHGLMFKKAEETYRKLKLSLQNEGEYELAGDFYYREMKMRRIRKFHQKNFDYWLLSHLYSKICGYGEKSHRVILSWFIIILLYGLFYQVFSTLDIEAITNDFDYYYFSVVTFTTLGFGDIHPEPSLLIGKIAAMSEALLGTFMMALFVLVFGRKMLR